MAAKSSQNRFVRFAAPTASQMRVGVSGWRSRCTPSGASASHTALNTAGGAPMAPPSPSPCSRRASMPGSPGGDLQVGRIGGRRQQVVHERRRHRVADVVVGVLLQEHPADALDHAAGDLALDDRGVDHPSAVLGDDVAQDLHHPGAHVDLDGDHVAGVRPDGRRRDVAVDHLEARLHPLGEQVRPVVGGHGDVGDRDGAAGRAGDRDRPLLDGRGPPGRPRGGGRRWPGSWSSASSPLRSPSRRSSGRYGCRRSPGRTVTSRCRPGGR